MKTVFNELHKRVMKMSRDSSDKADLHSTCLLLTRLSHAHKIFQFGEFFIFHTKEK